MRTTIESSIKLIVFRDCLWASSVKHTMVSYQFKMTKCKSITEYRDYYNIICRVSFAEFDSLRFICIQLGSANDSWIIIWTRNSFRSWNLLLFILFFRKILTLDVSKFDYIFSWEFVLEINHNQSFSIFLIIVTLSRHIY